MSENMEMVVADEAKPAMALSNTVMSRFEDSGRATIFNALNNALSLSKDAPETLTLKGLICMPGIRAVSGDPCIDTYLVDSDGQAYFTQSTGIGNAARDLLGLYNDNVAGLVIAVEEAPIGGGRTIKRLRIVSEPEA